MLPRSESATIGELQRAIEWHDSVGGGLEAVRRLCELVPLLEAIGGDAELRPECVAIRRLVKEAITLAKGGEEK